MPQDLNSSRINPNLLSEPICIKLALGETSMDTLMDELFEELEQDLNRSDLTAQVSSRMVLQPVHQADTQKSVRATPLQELPGFDYLLEGNTDLVGTEISRGVNSPEQTQSQPSAHRINGGLLLGVAAAIIIPLLVWIGHLPRTVTPTPEVTGNLEDSANHEFAAYMQRSLERIDQKVAIQPVKAPVINAPIPATEASPSVVTVTERVYIPVYQPQPPQSNPAQPLQNDKPPLPKVAAAPAAVISAPSAPAQTLVGVLELGDRSVALVGSSGVTRRVQVGEMLSPGGWLLVKVSDQKAIIQRQGELRSIYVGQKF